MRQYNLASISPRSSQEDDFPLDNSPDSLPTTHRRKSACLFTDQFLAPWVGSFAVSGDFETVSIPEGSQFSASSPRASDAHVSDIFHGPIEEHVSVWTHSPAIMATPIDKNRHPANNTGVVVSYKFQNSISQALKGPRCTLPPEQAPPSQPGLYLGQAIVPPHFSSSACPYDHLTAPSTKSRAPQSQSRSADAMERHEKKTWCSLCEVDFSQSQVLSRHKKDIHNAKESCLFCSTFKWSQGRPYLYRNHLRIRHPEILLPEIRLKNSKKSKKHSKPQARTLGKAPHLYSFLLLLIIRP